MPSNPGTLQSFSNELIWRYKGVRLAEVVIVRLNCPQLVIFTTPVKTADRRQCLLHGRTSNRTGAPTAVLLANLPLLTAVRDHIILPKIHWTYWIGTNPNEFTKILIRHLRNHLGAIKKVRADSSWERGWAERTHKRGQKLPARENRWRTCSEPAHHTLACHVKFSLSGKRNAQQQTETTGCCCRLLSIRF